MPVQLERSSGPGLGGGPGGEGKYSKSTKSLSIQVKLLPVQAAYTAVECDYILRLPTVTVRRYRDRAYSAEAVFYGFYSDCAMML